MFSSIIFASLLAIGSCQRLSAQEPEYPRYPNIESCPEPYGLQLYPHPDSCHSFFKCANGTLTYETCENGLLFDGQGQQIHNHCNYHWGVNCEGRPADLVPVNNGICEFAFGLYSNGPCEVDFSQCEYAEPVYVPCPEGLAYDERIHGCNWPDLIEYCQPEKIVGFQCPSSLDPKDPAARFNPFPRFAADTPSSYFVCVEGQPRRVNCGDYSLFNPHTLGCEEQK